MAVAVAFTAGQIQPQEMVASAVAVVLQGQPEYPVMVALVAAALETTTCRCMALVPSFSIGQKGINHESMD